MYRLREATYWIGKILIGFVVFLVVIILTLTIMSHTSIFAKTIPEINSVTDLKILVSTVGKSTDIPVVSKLFSMVNSDYVYKPSTTFDIKMYPYYGQLNDDEKLIYTQIYENTERMKHSFFLANQELSEEQVENAWLAVCYDHPELFWVGDDCSLSSSKDGKVLSMYVEYNDLEKNIEENKKNFRKIVNDIVFDADGYKSVQGKELFVHDKLAQMVDYDINAEHDQSAYGALIDRTTACGGYARAFQYIMTKCGVPCYYVTGWSDGNHAWNIVEIEGEYYNVDVTWDDTLDSHSFMNRTDDDFKTTHVRRENALQLPECNGSTYRNTEPMPIVKLVD